MYNLLLLRILSILFSLAPLTAIANTNTCIDLLVQNNSRNILDASSRLLDYEQSRIAALNGDFEKSILINKTIREKISSMPIVETFEGNYGSHGAYRAQLEDGTMVLIKPHNDDWYSSIPKEVGSSIFAEVIGLPLIPVAGFRMDPISNTPASVHLLQKVNMFQQFRAGLFSVMTQFRNANDVESRAKYFGSDISFLMGTLGYSSYEAHSRHVLNQTVQGVRIKSLIDLGSAFVDFTERFSVQDAPYVMLPENVMRRIEGLELSDLEGPLAPFFPDGVTQALLENIRLSVRAMRVYQNSQPSEVEEVNKAVYGPREFYIPQKWRWAEAHRPPQMAIDFSI